MKDKNTRLDVLKKEINELKLSAEASQEVMWQKLKI